MNIADHSSVIRPYSSSGSEVELVVAEGQPGRLLDAELEVRPPALLPLGAELRVVEVDPHDPGIAEPLGPFDGEHALAAAHVEHG
jgi:hypothetical protein